MSLHNKKEFERFLELRQIVRSRPLDLKLVKQDLKENYYFQRLNSLSDVRRHMNEAFEYSFFGSSTRRFFKTARYKFSKTDLTITCFNDGGTREVVYDIVFSNDNLELRKA